MKKTIYFLAIMCVLFSCKDDETNDPAQKQTWYQDADADTFGNKDKTLEAVTKPEGYVANNEDCDDTNANINPNATEVADGIDNNCDGAISKCTSDTDCEGKCVLGFCNSATLHEKFEKKYFKHEQTNASVPYRYHIPAIKDKKLPLIVALHGLEFFSQTEEYFLKNVRADYDVLGWVEDRVQNQNPSYVLAPNLHTEISATYSDNWSNSNSLDLVTKLVAKFIEDNPNVDTDRIYLTGHSGGGNGVWYIGGKSNNLFTALVPLSNASSEATLIEIKKLINEDSYKNIPIWVFTHWYDQPQSSRALIKTMVDNGIKPVYTHQFGTDEYNLTTEEIKNEINNDKKYFYTEYDFDCGNSNTNCHFFMHKTLREPLLFEWLFKQQKK